MTGVLTKPDRIPPGEEKEWLKFIRNEREPLKHGWFSAKQPGSLALASGITWDQARSQECEFFDSTAPWSEISFEFLQQLGTENLTNKLSNVLLDLICERQALFTRDIAAADILNQPSRYLRADSNFHSNSGRRNEGAAQVTI